MGLFHAIIFLGVSLTCVLANVPALFLFGDSEVDNGNNNYLNTSARANYASYGIDYPNHVATGRYSNGLLVADYIASYLGLPSPPPYYKVRDGATYPRGANFASGTSGVLSETHIGASVVLSGQVSAFKNVRKGLILGYGHSAGLDIVMRSIYLISTTTNDINNANVSKGVPYDRIISAYSTQIKRLYKLGARKFVLVGQIANGCIPLNIVNGTCGEVAQNISTTYILKFKKELQHLRGNLKKVEIVEPNFFRLMLDVHYHPEYYGFENSIKPCCELSSNLVTCQLGGSYCPQRTKFAYWDAIHNTQVFYKMAAQLWWFGSTYYVTPMNIQQLAAT